MSKLLALLPLLGWFYLSLFGIIVLYYAAGKFGAYISRLFVLGVIFLMFYLSLQDVKLEYAGYTLAVQNINKPWQRRISDELGDVYQRYYGTFHSMVPSGALVHLYGIDTREFLIARMYMYPASMIEYDFKRPLEPGYAILQKGDLKKISSARILAEKDGRVLVYIGEP